MVLVYNVGPEGFAWKICREPGAAEVYRSTLVFATRIETILDAARAAAMLDINPSSISGQID